MKNSKISILAESAVMVALATVLGLIKIWQAPFGGSVTLFSMVPILLIAFRHGPVWGCSAGFVTGLLNLLLDLGTLSYIPTPAGIAACIVLDYLLAYAILGTAGFFRNMTPFKNPSANAIFVTTLGVFVAVFLRFACHVFSGAVIWYDLTKLWYPDEPDHIVNRFGPFVYSVIYNCGFMLPETVLTLVATPLIRRLLAVLSPKH